MSKPCERCEDSGIVCVVTVAGVAVPLTCDCQVGKNAKESNPDWGVADLQEPTK